MTDWSKKEECCGNCFFFRPYMVAEKDQEGIPSDKGTCHNGPPIRLPRRFAAEATAESRMRLEELLWDWPETPAFEWCGEHDTRKRKWYYGNP